MGKFIKLTDNIEGADPCFVRVDKVMTIDQVLKTDEKTDKTIKETQIGLSHGWVVTIKETTEEVMKLINEANQ